tara:strand:+ start:28 stop:366 length:339 start_codon:yes stop_codon:yes gene_type:complete
MDEKDIIDMVNRKIRVEELAKIRQKELEEEKKNISIAPISYQTEEIDLNDFLFDDEDLEDDEDNAIEDNDPTPPKEFDPIEEYKKYLYSLDERSFLKICIKKGIVNPDHVFD